MSSMKTIMKYQYKRSIIINTRKVGTKLSKIRKLQKHLFYIMDQILINEGMTSQDMKVSIGEIFRGK